MGKIRIKALGDENREKKQKAADQARREGKKLAKLKGKSGGRIVEVEGIEIPEQEPRQHKDAESEETLKNNVSVSQKSSEPLRSQEKHEEYRKRTRSTRYTHVRALVDKTKVYPLTQALDLVRKTSLTRFDATVEMHINTEELGIRGSVTLPYGTGKQLKVAVVTNELLADIEKGKINFDVLISSPSFMPKLARLAKVLGPKGLMPNPKSGTISENPEEAAKKFSGTLQYKTEAEFPIIHTIIGKVGFENKKLEENFWSLINAIGAEKIKSVFLKSTMSPSVRVKLD